MVSAADNKLKLVGARIKEIRKERGLSQEELGEKAGFHYSYIGRIERGEKNIALKNVFRIADALEIEVYQLFTYNHLFNNLTEKEGKFTDILLLLLEREPKELNKVYKILVSLFEEEK